MHQIICCYISPSSNRSITKEKHLTIFTQHHLDQEAKQVFKYKFVLWYLQNTKPENSPIVCFTGSYSHSWKTWFFHMIFPPGSRFLGVFFWIFPKYFSEFDWGIFQCWALFGICHPKLSCQMSQVFFWFFLSIFPTFVNFSELG